MNTQKAVNKRLFSKEEVALTKVDLSSISEINKLINKLKGFKTDDYKDIQKLIPVIKKEHKVFERLYKNYILAKTPYYNMLDDATKEVEKLEDREFQHRKPLGELRVTIFRFEKQAKELGIDVKSIPEYSEAVNFQEEQSAVIKVVQKLVKQVKKEIQNAGFLSLS